MKLKDKIKLKIVFKPFKTRGEHRTIGYYDDKTRTQKVIEIDTREPVSNMVEIIYHEFTHLTVTYFALDKKSVAKIKKAMNGKQYKFRKVNEDKEHKICERICRFAKKVFEEELGK